MNETRRQIIPSDSLTGGLSSIFPGALDPDALWIVKRLQKQGHLAYFVGGCVRDLLLGQIPKDFDVATSARPRQIKKIFRNSRIIGRRFRLVHVHFPQGKVVEVSTFRKDPRQESRNAYSEEDLGAEPSEDLPEDLREDEVPTETDEEPGVPNAGSADLLITEDNVFGTEEEDALRRDFSINALFYDVENRRIIDYTGGVEDLERRVLKTIGNAATRLREDPVRILRAVKFATRHDLFLDAKLAAAMAEYHGDLLRSAPPRVCEELLRMLGGANPAKSFEILARLGILWVLFPELSIRPHDESNPRLTRLLRRLQVLGEIDRGQRSYFTANYFSVLLYDSTIENLHSDPSRIGPEAIDEVLKPFATRYRISRRDLARMRSAFMALRRIDPKLASVKARRKRHRVNLHDFVRREYFLDALLLFRFVSEAENRDHEALKRWEQRCWEEQVPLPYSVTASRSDERPRPEILDGSAEKQQDWAGGRRRRRRRASESGRIRPPAGEDQP